MNPDTIYNAEMTGENCILHKLLKFIDAAIRSFFIANKAAILLENRPKLYLSRHDNIVSIKEQCVVTNEDYRVVPLEEKALGLSFLESFPSL